MFEWKGCPFTYFVKTAFEPPPFFAIYVAVEFCVFCCCCLFWTIWCLILVKDRLGVSENYTRLNDMDWSIIFL